MSLVYSATDGVYNIGYNVMFLKHHFTHKKVTLIKQYLFRQKIICNKDR